MLSQPGVTGNYLIEVSLKDRLDHMLVKVEASGNSTLTEPKLRALFRQSLGIAVDVEICARGRLPASNGKAMRVADLRPKN